MTERLSPNMVDWHAPEYQASLLDDREQADATISNAAFGVAELEQVDYSRQTDPFEVRSTEVLEAAKANLADAAITQLAAPSQHYTIEQLAGDLAAAGVVVADQSPEHVAHEIQQLDAASFEHFLRTHIAREQEREAAFQQQVEQFKGHYAEATINAVTAGRLPATVDADAIVKRVQQMRFVGLDPLNGDDNAWYDESTHGVYMPRASWSWADPMVGEADGERVSLFHIASHEVGHGVGGKAVVEQDGKYSVTHSGASSEDAEGVSWLEEALAEKTRMLTFDVEQSTVRADEREILELVLTKGSRPISRALPVEAFLQDHVTPEAPTIWDEFRSEVAVAYDPDFLQVVDELLADGDEDSAQVVAAYLRQCTDPRRASADLRRLVHT